MDPIFRYMAHFIERLVPVLETSRIPIVFHPIRKAGNALPIVIAFPTFSFKMSHNGQYYLKKLSKKPPPGCAKLTNFGFGKQVVDCQPSPPKISKSGDKQIDSATTSEQLGHKLDVNNNTQLALLCTEAASKDDESSAKGNNPWSFMLPANQTKETNVQCQGQNETIQSGSPQISTCAIQTEQSPLLNSEMASVSSCLSPKYDGRKLFSDLKWEQTYTWLYYSCSKNGYLCKICELFSTESTGNSQIAFVDRGVQFGQHPGRQLDKHAESKRHCTAAMRYSQFTTNINVYKQLQAQDQNEVTRNREVIKKQHRCLYFLIRQKWAVSENFEIFVKFVADLGVEDLARHLQSCQNLDDNENKVTYMSSKIVSQMIENLGEVLERRCLASLGDKKFALLADESTDKANRSQLAIYCRWNDNGSVSDHFMGLIEMDRTRAEDFMRAIETFFIAKGIDIKNVRFMGFDGCATMSGTHKGLQRRMTNASPFAVYINCRNHRLALCLKHLTKSYPLLSEVDNTLLSLYNLFEFSPQKLAVFLAVQEAYGQRPLILVRASMTRWISHLHASVRFIERYESLLDALDNLYAEFKQPEVFGIRHFVVRRDIVALILLLCDVLRPVNFLSLYLQEDQVNFTHLDTRVKQTLDDLHQLIAKYQSGNYAESDFEKCEEIFEVITERTDLAQRRRNAVDEHYTPAQFLQTVGVPFIYSLIAEIEDAFHSSPLLNAFGVLDPRNLPDTIADLTDYGLPAIQRLSEVYTKPAEDTFQGHHTIVPPDLDSQQSVETELKSFIMQLYMLKQKGCLSVTDVQKEFEKDAVIRACFSRVYQLVIYSLLIPASTAVVERGFSLMNDICTPLRSRLTQNHLTCLMRIISEGPESLTDIMLEDLVEAFKNQKKRKLKL